MQAAQSWAELHQVMRANSLQLRERGNGLVITAQDGTTVKASSIRRDWSKNKLEARLGPFESSQEPDHRVEPPARQYQQQPLCSRVNTVGLYARYQAQQQTLKASAAVEWTQARERKSQLIEAAKRSGRLKRAAIKLTCAGRLAKKLMYASTSKTLRDEIEKINKEYLRERQEIYERCKRRTWADWLRAKAIEGDQEALEALRARDAAQGLKGNTVSGTGHREPALVRTQQNGITKQGTIIYRVGPTAMRDDGSRLSVSRGVTSDGLQAALRMAIERYGNSIAVGGSAAFKQQVAEAAASAQLALTFDDPALERRRQQLTHIRNESTQPERQHDRQEHGPTGQARPGPRDVSRHVEDREAESHHALRKDRPAGLMPAQAVANRLVVEDQAERVSGADPAKRTSVPVDAPAIVTAKGTIKRRGP